MKDVAFAVAKANDTLPGYSTAPECQLYCTYVSLATELREGEVCLFINGSPAKIITGFTLDNNAVIGKLCTLNLVNADFEEGLLVLTYVDGVKERYQYIEGVEAYQFLNKNISINVPSRSAN